MSWEEWNETLDQNLDQAVHFRRDMHQHPELAFREYKTTAKIAEKLDEMGVERIPLLETGVVGILRCGEGKTVLLREDIDALPMREVTGLPFASAEDGVCHACGHDIHTSALLLAAKVLCEHREEIHGNVVFVFQPAEETASGAKKMIGAGLAAKLPPVDSVVGFHVEPSLPAGTAGFFAGASNASTDEIDITVRSAGGHGAHPYRCADSVLTAGFLLTALQTVVSRENPAVQPAVLTFGSIHGGTAANVIPTEVTMKGTLRTFNTEGRKRMIAAIRRISEDTAAAMRAEADVTVLEGVPVLYNDPDVDARLAKAADAVLGSDHVAYLEYPSPGSDDFSCFLDFAPGEQFRIGTGTADPNSRLGLHNPGNLFDESAIRAGAAVLSEYTRRELSEV